MIFVNIFMTKYLVLKHQELNIYNGAVEFISWTTENYIFEWKINSFMKYYVKLKSSIFYLLLVCQNKYIKNEIVHIIFISYPYRWGLIRPFSDLDLFHHFLIVKNKINNFINLLLLKIRKRVWVWWGSDQNPRPFCKGKWDFRMWCCYS